MYLLDTMVLSDLRKHERNPRLVTWLNEVKPVDLYLSVVTIGEVERGIAKQRRLDPGFAERLASWLDAVLHHYGSRVLLVDTGSRGVGAGSRMHTTMQAPTS